MRAPPATRRALLDVVAARAGVIAILVAPGWLEDLQVAAFLAEGLRQRGCRAEVISPQQLSWRDGIALPETRDPRHARWSDADEWILKGAFGNTGDTVLFRSEMGCSTAF